MVSNKAYVTLNNGIKVPQLGYGTYKNKNAEVTIESVYHAIKVGYRQIDTAAIYLNEKVVGMAINRAIKEGIVTREELFIVTKLWGTQHRMVETAIKQSLERLGLDYVDLYLMHWPIGFLSRTIDTSNPINYLTIPKNPENKELYDADLERTPAETYNDMQKLVAKGYTKSIGISNFSLERLKTLLDAPTTTIIPVVHQVEVQPLFPQEELIEYSLKHKILTQAYAPMGSWGSEGLLVNPTLVGLAEKYKVDPAQICISWGLQRGSIVIPKSSNLDRITRNFENVVTLSEEDFEIINQMPDKYGKKRMILANNFPPIVLFD
ncbi:hypothetical protein QEN19_000863 [Hanseniaspora menglaensis]